MNKMFNFRNWVIKLNRAQESRREFTVIKQASPGNRTLPMQHNIVVRSCLPTQISLGTPCLGPSGPGLQWCFQALRPPLSLEAPVLGSFFWLLYLLPSLSFSSLHLKTIPKSPIPPSSNILGDLCFLSCPLLWSLFLLNFSCIYEILNPNSLSGKCSNISHHHSTIPSLKASNHCFIQCTLEEKDHFYDF